MANCLTERKGDVAVNKVLTGGEPVGQTLENVPSSASWLDVD